MKVFVKSFGCSTNLADGEVLAGCLAEAGYIIVDSVDDADLVIYNTCAVKGPTENRIIEALKRVPACEKLIIAGCLPLINFNRVCSEVKFDGIVGPAVGRVIVEITRRVFNGEKIISIDGACNAKPDLDLPRRRLNPIVSIIPINYGCLGSCAYCCVIFARGHLRSYSVQEILKRIRSDLAEGALEFWVTSQDTACYGKDIETSLPELLKAICNINGDFKIRVGMMTPNMVVDILDDLIQAFRNEKLFKFIHLPVQSGDDEILRCMRRFYSIDEFEKIVAAFRSNFPEITLVTDVICGFPSESEENFEKTLKLIEKIKPDIVNVSKFFARPKTLAAEMRKDFVSFGEIKRRSAVMADLARKIGLERNQQWIGWKGEILFDEFGKVSNSLVGRNFAYKPIVVKNAKGMFGKKAYVKIVKAFPTYLEGEIT